MKTELEVWNLACKTILQNIAVGFRANMGKVDKQSDADVYEAIADTITMFPVPECTVVKPVLSTVEIEIQAYKASQKRTINIHGKYFIEGYEQCLIDQQTN